MLLKISLSLILLLFVLKSYYCLECKDENNNSVDWFVAYKLPKIKHDNNLLKDGLAYVYMTSNSYDSWTFSNKSVNSTESIFAKTLSPLYKEDQEEDLSYILYNDQPPTGESKNNKGHTKGVVLLNEESGLWLVHSVPHFPSISENSYFYPHTGALYGQSFLCISLDATNLNEIGLQLQYNEPQIYEEKLTDNLKKRLPNLADAAANVTIASAPWFRQTKIYSAQNKKQFASFAKSKNFGKELYVDWVAPALQKNLYVETWPNGAGALPSDCTKAFKVNNVDYIEIDAVNATFKRTHDHAKWAVSASSDPDWICVGDINRMEDQLSRGGGTVCTNDKLLANNYRRIIESVDNCTQ